MKPAVQDAGRNIVVTSDNDYLAIWDDACVQPDEQPMFGHPSSGDTAAQSVERPPHALSRFNVTPPVEAIRFAAVSLAHGPDVFLDVGEGRLVKRGVCLRHSPTEIHNLLARWAAGQVHAVDPGLENIGIGLPIRIGRKAKPFSSEITGNVERSTLGITHEGNSDVRRDALRPGQVDSGPVTRGRKVGVDFVGGLAVETRLGLVDLRAVVLSDRAPPAPRCGRPRYPGRRDRRGSR